MDETTILLVPAPGAKPEFLATVEPIGGGGTAGSTGDLPFEVVLSSYTRDAWAMTAPPPTEPWKTTWLKSVDGRGKLPGFLKYLKERKKVPFGRFEPATAQVVAAESPGGKGVIIVPFEQPTLPPNILGDGSDASVNDLIYCRYILNDDMIGRGYRLSGPPPGKATQQQHQRLKQQQQQTQRKLPPAVASAPKPPAKSSRESSGMLGNLLGATRRTNTRLDTVPAKKSPAAAAVPTGGSCGVGGDVPISGSGAVVAEFRQEVEQKMLDFSHDPAQTCLKIPVSLGDVVRELPFEQKRALSLDVLKYVIYEQAEEVGQDKWVAAKEPSEFMDECVVAVYKEGCAPDEVLEDLNKAELPDEVVQQQRAMRQARVKEVARKETKEDALRHKATVGSGAPDEEAWTLNTQKRDRRTIEEIQQEMEAQKRQRSG